MASSHESARTEGIRKILQHGGTDALADYCANIHHADLAQLIKKLSDDEAEKLWRSISSNGKKADVLLELEDSDIINFIEAMPPSEAAVIFREMASDDITNIVHMLKDTVVGSILQHFDHPELSSVVEQLNYKENTAGAVMNRDVFTINEDITVKNATKLIHQAQNIEMVYYLYVVDTVGRITGVLSLRQLITNPPLKKLKEIMTTDVISVGTDVDQEDVAKVVEKYDFVAVPVVNNEGVLVGVITVDDIIDIIRAEATEDFYKLAGTSDNERLSDSPIRIARIRMQWLSVTFVGSFFAGLLINFFEGHVTNFLMLMTLIPVVMAMGGNVGSQSATIIIRGIASGAIDVSHIPKVILREVRVGVVMGLVSGIITSAVTSLWGQPFFGIIAGVSLFAVTIFSTLIGALVPAALIKLKFDPAVASVPFILMIIDISGLVIYFTIAILMMSFFS